MLLITRDVILVLCAVISAACLLYIAMNLNTGSEEDAGVDETPRASLEEPRNRTGARSSTSRGQDRSRPGETLR